MNNRNCWLPAYVLIEPSPEGWLLVIEAGNHQIPVAIYNTETEAALNRDLLDAALDVRLEDTA